MSTSPKPLPARERVIFSLPPELAREVQEYARITRHGNKSGFVADALRAYIRSLRDTRHTQKLRDSYAAAGRKSQVINQQWEHLDAEAWEMLDRLEPLSPA